VSVLGVSLLTGCRTLPAAKATPGAKASAQTNGHQKSSRAENRALAAEAEAHAHYGVGVIHELNGENDAAMEEFRQAALKDPDDETLILEVSWRFLQAKQPDKALELLGTAVRRPKASSAIYARLGFVYSRLDRNKEAIAANRKAIEKAPRAIAGYRNLYLSYIQIHQPAKAMHTLDEAAKQPNAEARFYINLAELYGNYAQQFPSQRAAVNAKALIVLERAEKLKPRDAQLRLKLADGFFAAGKRDKAARLYLDVLDELTDFPQARELVRTRLASIYLRDSDRKRAIEQLEAIVRDDPSNARAYYFLGLIAYEEQRWADMTDYLKRTLLFSPNFEEAYYDLAAGQIAMGNGDEALSTLGTARAKFPQSFKLEYWLALANQQQKNYAEAIKHFGAAEAFAQATDTNLLTRAFYFAGGAAYERAGDHGQARDYFEKGLKLQPDTEQAYFDLATTQIELGAAGEAIATLELARKKFPENFVIEYLYGEAQVRQKNYAEAIKHFGAAELIAQAKDTNRLTHAFYFEVGAAHERNGDRAQAEAYFEKCLKLNPDFAEALNYLGYMWAERGEKLDRARELIEKALKVQPKNAAYLDSMAWVLFKQNQPRPALDYILKAVELTKEPDATLYDHLGDIYAALNDMDKARDAWRKSLSVEKSDAVQKKLEGPRSHSTQ
jgi:tetratricopeptide (TPR) repeat protein